MLHTEEYLQERAGSLSYLGGLLNLPQHPEPIIWMIAALLQDEVGTIKAQLNGNGAGLGKQKFDALCLEITRARGDSFDGRLLFGLLSPSSKLSYERRFPPAEEEEA